MSQPHGNNNNWGTNTDRVMGSAWDGTATNLSIKAAPGTGSAIFITDITVIQGATARAFSVLDGSGGGVLFKCAPAIGVGQSYVFKTPLKCTSNTALCLTSAGATAGGMILFGGFVGRG